MLNRVVKFERYGQAEVLNIEVEKVQDSLDDNEVLVKMSSYAINRANALFREGNYLMEASFPSRIGSEGVGVVEQKGSGVVNVNIGDRVNLLPPTNESEKGYFADYNVVDNSRLLPTAKAFNDYEASTSWVPFLTAYNKFVEEKQVKKDEWVIIGAASSSVSLAAMSVSKHLGAKTIGLTRSNDKVESLLALGYDEVVVTADKNTREQIKNITKVGASFAFDPVGGEGIDDIVNSLQSGSELCVFGVISPSTPLPIFSMMNTGVKISCYTIYELFMDEKRLTEAVEYFLPLFEQRKLIPTFDKNVFELQDVQKAFFYMESNAQVGKVLLKS